jgi:hypothetical protein
MWGMVLVLLFAWEAAGAESKITVEVVDGAGKPVPNARVVQAGVGTARQRMHSMHNTYETDGKGVFTFNLAPGTAFSVSVSKPGTVSVDRDLTMPAQGEVKERFVLAAAANISGTVVDGAGLAVGNCTVTANLPGCTPKPGTSCMAAMAHSAADGTFTLQDVPVGKLRLWVGAPGGRSWEQDVTAPASGIKLALPAAVTITGKVMKDGKPAAGVKIFIETPKNEPLSKEVRMARKVFGPGVPGVSATTGADGRFSIGNLQQQGYAIWAEGDGVESKDQVVMPGTEVVLKLDQKSP